MEGRLASAELRKLYCRRQPCAAPKAFGVPGLKIIWASSALRCGEKERPLPNGCWCVWRIIAGCWPQQKLKASRRSKLLPKTARPHREVFLPAPARRRLVFYLLAPSGLWAFHFPNRFPKSDSPTDCLRHFRASACCRSNESCRKTPPIGAPSSPQPFRPAPTFLHRRLLRNRFGLGALH